ncbi:MAG: dihydroneopterin aldolase [Paracoccaceae bacterium]|jgi:dihydroneopterin aldolase
MDETSIEFELPHVRSAATGGADPLDRISVRDYLREVEIGAFQAERGVTQRIRFNVVLEVARTRAAQSDDVDKVISYDTIVEAIELQLSTERINLLETLAERIAERCLEDRRVARAFVRIEKLDRIPGTLGIEIVRAQTGDGSQQIRPVEAVETVDETPHPLVVYLSNEVLHGPNLPTWLDVIAGHETPAVICVEKTVEVSAHARHPMADRRIGLLAIEQNAWVLAGMDKRCVVVDSRTEMDWAMKHGQLSVWAPSKIVLDSVEQPEADAETPEALAMWFAEQFAASKLVIVAGREELQNAGLEISVLKADAPEIT